MRSPHVLGALVAGVQLLLDSISMYLPSPPEVRFMPWAPHCLLDSWACNGMSCCDAWTWRLLSCTSQAHRLQKTNETHELAVTPGLEGSSHVFLGHTACKRQVRLMSRVNLGCSRAGWVGWASMSTMNPGQWQTDLQHPRRVAIVACGAMHTDAGQEHSSGHARRRWNTDCHPLLTLWAICGPCLQAGRGQVRAPEAWLCQKRIQWIAVGRMPVIASTQRKSTHLHLHQSEFCCLIHRLSPLAIY